MKNSTIVTSLIFALLVGSTAWADIFTPALNTGNADSVVCRVLNTGTSTAKTVVTKFFDNAGTQQGGIQGAIEAGAARTTTSNPNPSSVLYCRVSGISKSKARVTLCLLDANDTPIECVIGQ